MSLFDTLRTRAADVVNLFATPLKASHYLELVNPLWTSHKLQARVVDVWDETPDALFEWGVGLHEIDFDKVAGPREERATQIELLRGFGRKAARQIAKDYALWPALAGPRFPEVLVANAVANVVRNLWSRRTR